MRRKKWLSLLLAVIMTVSLAGCGGNASVKTSGGTGAGTEETEGAGTEETDGTEGTEEEEAWERPFDKYIQDEEVVDLGGYNFKIVDFNTNIWRPEEIRSEQDQLIVNIVEDVEKTFNCTIEVEEVSPDTIFNNAQPAIMSGDKYADLLGTTLWAYGSLLGGQLLTDLSEVDSLDFTQDGFNKGLSDIATFGGATYGFGASFGSPGYAVIYYNDRIWTELGLPDPYELVQSGEWTWAKLLEYGRMAIRDNDGNGIVDSVNDRWGLVAPNGDLITNMYLSMGGNFYTENEEGKMRLSCLDSDSAAKMKFIYDFFQNENVLYKNENVGFLEMFYSGKSLFLLYGSDIYDDNKNMEDDWGVLPLPKWTPDQEEYLNPVNHNAKIYSIPSSNKNTYEAGVIITALAKRYQALYPLTLQEMADTYWRSDTAQAIMEEYVVESTYVYDVIDIIKNANSNFGLPNGVLFDAVYNNSYSDITSTIAQYEEALDILLDEFFANLSK